jgi:hypothetical protein
MAITGVSSTGAYATGQAAQTAGQHKQNRPQLQPVSAANVPSLSGSSTPSATGKTGNKIDITA